MTKLLQQCFLFFIVVVIPGHNLGNTQVSVNRTIGPTLGYSSSSSLNAPSNDQDGDVLRLLMETNNSGKRDLVLSKIMKSFSSHFWLKCSSCANNLMK